MYLFIYPRQAIYRVIHHTRGNISLSLSVSFLFFLHLHLELWACVSAASFHEIDRKAFALAPPRRVASQLLWRRSASLFQ